MSNSATHTVPTTKVSFNTPNPHDSPLSGTEQDSQVENPSTNNAVSLNVHNGRETPPHSAAKATHKTASKDLRSGTVSLREDALRRFTNKLRICVDKGLTCLKIPKELQYKDVEDLSPLKGCRYVI